MNFKSILLAISLSIPFSDAFAQNEQLFPEIPEGAKYIDNLFIESLSDKEVQKALSNEDVIGLIAPDSLTMTKGPNTTPIQSVTDVLLSPELISKLADKDVQEALKIPVIQSLVFSDGSVNYGGRPVGQPQPRPRGKYVSPDLLQTLSDTKVQNALQLPAIVKLIELSDGSVNYGGRPVGQPQPRPRGYLSTELIESLGNTEVQEALKMPLIQELIFGQDYDPAAFNGRPVGMGQPRPRK